MKPDVTLQLVASLTLAAAPAGVAVQTLAAPQIAQREDGLVAALIGAARLPGRTGAEAGIDADTLLDLYREQGRQCAAQLQGSWAFVIVDKSQQRIVLATDRMGRQPLYYRIEGDCIHIGTAPQSLNSAAAPLRLGEQGLYNYLYFHMIPAPGAAWEGCCKLQAAELLELNGSGHERAHYWMPPFAERSAAAPASQAAGLKRQLEAAVQRCVSSLPAAAKVGAFLSGGLDSSTVAGLLAELQGGSCDAYAIGFDAEGYDEMAYARISAAHFGIRLHEYYVTPDDVVQALPQIAAAYHEPFGNSSALPAYFCARMAAADGIDTLLAGDGGDELFAGNERYARQKVFEPWQRLPQWLRAHMLEPLAGALPAQVPLVAKLRSYILQANIPLPERLQYYSFLEQNEPDTVFVADIVRRIDKNQPLDLLRAIYAAPAAASSLNRMLYLDWQITLADNDLRKVSQACALAGVRVSYPMLDEELVNFAAGIPSAWKLPGHKLRHFYKQALTGWLPDATIYKTKHGFGLPFGVWMKDHKPLQDLAYDNILRLKARGIFQPAFLEQAIAQHREGHASYYGELIWVLTALELWLAARQPDYCYSPR